MIQLNKNIKEHKENHEKLMDKLATYEYLFFIFIVLTFMSFLLAWWVIIILIVIDYIIYRFLIVKTRDSVDINNMVLGKMKECKENELRENFK